MSVLKHLVMCVCPWSSYQEEPVTRDPAGIAVRQSLNKSGATGR